MTCNNKSTQRNSWNGFYCIMCSEYKTSLLVCWQKIKISCHKRRLQPITLFHFDSHKFLLKDAYLYLSEYLFPGHKFHYHCNSYLVLIFRLETIFYRKKCNISCFVLTKAYLVAIAYFMISVKAICVSIISHLKISAML